MQTYNPATREFEGELSDWQTYFYNLSRYDYNRMLSMVNSFSGSDQAESEFYRLRGKFWASVADGADFDLAWAELEVACRQYAEIANTKVKNAPKFSGDHPRAGQSVIDHRWVSPTWPQTCKPFCRAMYGRAIEQQLSRV